MLYKKACQNEQVNNFLQQFLNPKCHVNNFAAVFWSFYEEKSLNL